MSILCDFHMHSSFSGDSEASMEDMILSAIRKGLHTICFTEHLDLDYPPDCGCFLLDFDAYRTKLLALKEKYRDQITVLFGMEMGMQIHLGTRYAAIARSLPFDFLIASQHLVQGADPYFPDFWHGQDETSVYSLYFENILRHLTTMEEYDTLGHLDYIVRYGPGQNRSYSYQKYADVIDPILRYLIEHGKCLEVNTAGLKYGLGHPNPEESVLMRYRELGGELITVGSDAHCPEHIAYDFSKAEQILHSLGFRYYTIFRDRKPTQLPL